MYKKLGTHIILAFLRFLSVWPLQVLYFLSDLMFPVIYHLVRYRRKVVRVNLINSFPEKNIKELIIIEKKYYRYLCDLFVETVKVKGFSLKEISKRMVLKNPELLNSCFKEGKSAIIITIHHGNWEWLLHMPQFLEHSLYFVYKPMQNSLFEKYWNSARARFGGKMVSMTIVLRKILEAEKSHNPVLTWLAVDQTPPWFHPFWIDFMNQETLFFNGPAKLAKRFDQSIYFQQIKRIRRGYYETWFEPLVLNPSEMTENDIIVSYVRKTESVIRNEPDYYLWSHRRWKHKKQQSTDQAIIESTNS
jgi:Kdo2-lipid IVA lauroyltransferase/acyltransferase